MIRIYLQYSYGGFKTFFIEGKENEEVSLEVTNDNRYKFPEDAYCYFQYGGVKMSYRYLKDGSLDLVVREIPSIHKDGDGRSIPCAVQFIGDASNRNQLDFMATDIANDIQGFHNFFSLLFCVRNGLRIDGKKLKEWIDKHNVPFVCETSVNQIRGISRANVNKGMIFFVALSSNFGMDATVTKNVAEELQLPINQMQEDQCYMSVSALSRVQGKTAIQEGIVINPSDDTKSDSSPKSLEWYKQKCEDQEKIINDLKEKVNNQIAEIKTIKADAETVKSQNIDLLHNIELNKKVIYTLGGITVLLVGCCIYSLISK